MKELCRSPSRSPPASRRAPSSCRRLVLAVPRPARSSAPAVAAADRRRLAGTRPHHRRPAAARTSCCPAARDRRRAHVVRPAPTGASASRGLAAGDYTPSVDAPGLVLRGPRDGVGRRRPRRASTSCSSPAPVREHVVVSATRGEATLSTLGVDASTCSSASGSRSARRRRCSTLLQERAGRRDRARGRHGPQASVFIRGGESRYARVLVDGVAVNQPGGGFDFGTALPFELERVEVVRGAASSLYGTDALAGVVSLATRRAGAGETRRRCEPRAKAEASAGGAGAARPRARAAPSTGTSGAQRLDDRQRGAEQRVPSRRSRRSPRASRLAAGTRRRALSCASTTARLGDAGADRVRPPGPGRVLRARRPGRAPPRCAARGRASRHELRVGYARTRQLSLNPADSGAWTARVAGPAAAPTDLRLPQPGGLPERHASGSRPRLPGRGAARRAAPADRRRRARARDGRARRPLGAAAAAGAHELRRLRAGPRAARQPRLPDARRARRAATAATARASSRAPRSPCALRGGEDATTLRASAGMGIKEPSFLESYGESLFARGNPDLEPERSRPSTSGSSSGSSAGRLRGEVTYFHHDYRDQIAYTVVDFDTFEGTLREPRADTRAQGLEVALEARPRARLCARRPVHATWTARSSRARATSIPSTRSAQPLLRRPKHQGSSRRASRVRPRWSVGATLVARGRAGRQRLRRPRADDEPGYARLDARARVRARRAARGLRRRPRTCWTRGYQEVLGYPALGRVGARRPALAPGRGRGRASVKDPARQRT